MSLITYTKYDGETLTYVRRLVLITAVSLFLVSLATVSETYAPIILQRKAAQLRFTTRNWALHSLRDEEPVTRVYLLRKYALKPAHMMIREPILTCMTAFMSLVYAIMYLLFIGIPYAFQIERGWSATEASLPYLGLFGGYLIGFAICVFESNARALRQLQRSHSNGNNIPTPESHFPTLLLGLLLLLPALFTLAFTSYPYTTSPWPQLLSTLPLGTGIFLVFVPAQLYLLDVYASHAASALAGNAFCRAVLACIGTVFAGQMFERLGVRWGIGLVGFLGVGLAPFAVGLWVWGKRIREWSRFVDVQER